MKDYVMSNLTPEGWNAVQKPISKDENEYDTFFHSPEILKVPLGRKIPKFIENVINKFSWGKRNYYTCCQKSNFCQF
jgi:hypothetical protein